mmetsp:Transcript_28504/g.27480  ORF Transcript_28504/g.27480 Transcript_28504/m.27480 type:complete len:92 (-) Transcript_28504:888-1163(-)
MIHHSSLLSLLFLFTSLVPLELPVWLILGPKSFQQAFQVLVIWSAATLQCLAILQEGMDFLVQVQAKHRWISLSDHPISLPHLFVLHIEGA